MRINIYILFFLFIGLIFVNKCSFAQSNEIPAEISALIEEQLIKPLRSMHDPANAAMFSRAYIGSVWKYELFKKPEKNNKFYLFQLREYRGVFVVDQHNFKVYPDQKNILLEDWETGKHTEVPSWLEKYQQQKGK